MGKMVSSPSSIWMARNLPCIVEFIHIKIVIKTDSQAIDDKAIPIHSFCETKRNIILLW